MDLERAAAEFRAAARRAGPRGAGRRYPATLREAAVEYLRRRRAAGAPVSAIARELGVKRHTLLAWTTTRGCGPDEAGFVPVSVVADEPAPLTIVVYGPGGVRVEGLDMAGVIALLRGLA